MASVKSLAQPCTKTRTSLPDDRMGCRCCGPKLPDTSLSILVILPEEGALTSTLSTVATAQYRALPAAGVPEPNGAIGSPPACGRLGANRISTMRELGRMSGPAQCALKRIAALPRHRAVSFH